MITKTKKANIFLFLILILTLFFYSYYITENKGSIDVNKDNYNQSDNTINSLSGITKFSDVEYRIKSKKNNDYITKGKLAYINKNEPEIIQLEFVNSFTKLKDGSFLNVKSDKAKFIKNSKNIKYYQNVVITNKQATITAETANFFSSENLIRLEDLVYKDNKNLIKGDFAKLDTVTNNLKIEMKNKQERVYGQRKQ
jgi:hypothetical protein